MKDLWIKFSMAITFMFFLACFQSREAPVEKYEGNIKEFSHRGHWYLMVHGRFSTPFIHDPDCPCHQKKEKKIEKFNFDA